MGSLEQQDNELTKIELSEEHSTTQNTSGHAFEQGDLDDLYLYEEALLHTTVHWNLFQGKRYPRNRQGILTHQNIHYHVGI